MLTKCDFVCPWSLASVSLASRVPLRHVHFHAHVAVCLAHAQCAPLAVHPRRNEQERIKKELTEAPTGNAHRVNSNLRFRHNGL